MAAPMLAHSGRQTSRDEVPAPMQTNIHAPSRGEGAQVWDRPVPGGGAPGLWLLGAHGGAGVSTLCQWIGPAGDSLGRWPGGHGNQSPFVVLVAEESVTALAKAHILVRQYATGGAGSSAQLLGVLTVARVPGRRAQQVRQRRDVLAGLLAEISGGAAQMWAVPFVAGLTTIATEELPVWTLGQPASTKKRPGPREAVPSAVADLGTDLIDAARAHVAAWGGR